MDNRVLEKLEFEKIRDLLARLSRFEGGQKRALELVPSTDIDTINRFLNENTEAMECLRFGETTFLDGLKPLDVHLARVKSGGVLSAPELRDINRCLSATRQAGEYIIEKKYPYLAVYKSQMILIPELERKLRDAISDDGELRDDASPELKSVRRQINTLRLRIREYLQDFIRSANNQKYLQDTLITERDGRYVVPVKQEYRHEVQGIVHDESASGATAFIEPMAVVENNNRIRSLQLDEKREVERILRELSQSAAVYAEELSVNIHVLGDLDLIFARARLAYKMNAFKPEMNTLGIIDINRARHPLLGDKAVPVNIELGDRFDILIITGPNTGGKTVVLKTLGLLTIMAMSGLYVPARENSRMSVFKDIFVDIGDEQSIEQSLSTFSSHMKNIISMLEKANKNVLVLIDELGAGTDPVEGSALGRVILDEMRRHQARVVVTTHQSELKNYAYQHERVENGCVEFDPVSLQPTYKLTIGMPGQSNALAIASRLGLRRDLVDKARQLVPQNEMEIGNMIRQLKERCLEYENLSRELENIKLGLVKERDELRQEKKRYADEQEAIVSNTRREADIYLKDVKAEMSEVVEELRKMLKDSEKPPKWHEIEKTRHRLKQVPGFKSSYNLIEAESQEIKPGDYVHVKDINQKGYVIEGPNQQGEVTVQAGILKLTVKRDRLLIGQSPEQHVYRQRNQTFLEKARHISKEIDIRGKLVDEAIEELDKYLDDANLVGLDSVRIIHGKGTGALRKGVREYLRDHRYVKSFRDGLLEEGGHGVTVAELR
ncbi:endonuclease MutS2 [Syntrophomonas palmitatica]|uniref:endonuclease MutS2 n=1 Tax=Syntrophomonas palmitatica TaxID=402877 RepID=UPI0006D05709|nr:endonuclease MutS2 [Syntrophomonas palmitatica]